MNITTIFWDYLAVMSMIFVAAITVITIALCVDFVCTIHSRWGRRK